MKKTCKLFYLLLFVALITIVSGCSSDSESSSKSKKNNKETLSGYIKERKKQCDKKYTEECSEYYYYLNEFKCDDIKDKEIISFDNGVMILDDNSTYSYIYGEDKLYSNDQQCKKFSTDIKIKEIKGRYLVDSKGDAYQIYYDYSDNDITLELSKLSGGWEIDDIAISLIKDSSVKQYLGNFHTYTDGSYQYLFYVLKDDNNVYEIKYKRNEDYEYKKVGEEVFLKGDDYGTIKYVKISDYLGGLSDSETIPKIVTLVTDKGYYYQKEVETEACLKYEDVKCEYELVESEITKKYMDDIKYIGEYNTVLKDGSIINTNLLKSSLKN